MSFQSEAIFSKIEKALKSNPELSNEIQGVFEFQLTNDKKEKKTWVIDFQKGTVKSSSTPQSSGDCTLILSDKNCFELMSGKQDPTELFFSGELKIKGEMSLAMKLGDLKEHLDKVPSQQEKPSTTTTSTTTSSVSVDGFLSSEIFEKIQLAAQQSPDLGEGLEGTIEFKLTNGNDKQQSWVVDLKNKSVKTTSLNGKADCTLEMKDADCLEVMKGLKDATELFFSGELKISGDMGLAMKLGDLSEKIKSVKVSEKSSEKSSSSTSSSSSSGLSVDGFLSSKIFEQIAAGLKANPSVKDEVNGVYEFILKNESGKVQSWTVDLKNEGKVTLGSPKETADCVLEMSDKNCAGVMSGENDATELFFSGELQIKGDMGLAMKLGQLKQPTSKL